MDGPAGHDLFLPAWSSPSPGCVLPYVCVRGRFFPSLSYWWRSWRSVVVRPGVLPRQRADAFKGQLDYSATRYSAWSPIFRVDVVDIGPNLRLLYHDGLVGSVIHRWDGKQASLGQFGFDTDPRSLPFAVGGASPKNVLIVGAAGGHEILTSLYYHSQHIDAVELNPVTHSLVTDKFADYSGHLAQNPAVNYVEGDGRSFLARSDDTYNVVWYPAPDSYSATNAASAGAYVLSESYLYTSETIRTASSTSEGNGILAAQFGEFDYNRKANRTSRYVATARHSARRARDPRSFPPHSRRHLARRGRELLALHHPREARAVHERGGGPIRRRPRDHAGRDAAVHARSSREGRIGESPSRRCRGAGSTTGTTRIPTTSGRSPTTRRSSGTSPRSVM